MITTRPEGVVARPLAFDAPTEPIALDGADAVRRNREDVSSYIERYLSEHDGRMRERIAALGMTVPEFTREVLARGAANFLYTKLLLDDVRTGRITRADLDKGALPSGLEDYYSIHWERMRERAGGEFGRLYEPVAGFLIASARPRSVQWLTDVTGLSRREVLAVLDSWQPFFVPAGPGDQENWRVYHSSFQDFLRQRVGIGLYQRRIADHAIAPLEFDGDPDAW